MRRLFSTLSSSVVIMAAVFSSTVHATSFYITGTVATVGANLGTSIDGAGTTYEQYIERDSFEITLSFDPGQTPYVGAAGGGETASYRLLQTVITINSDEGPFTWTYSTPAAENNSHDFSITNNVFGYDRFNSGLSGATFSGPSLGPDSKNFSHWSFLWADYEAAVFSDTSIPASFDIAAFNSREITLVFDGFGFEDDITLSATAISVIPEPASFAFAGGLAGLIAVAAFRRRA